MTNRRLAERTVNSRRRRRDHRPASAVRAAERTAPLRPQAAEQRSLSRLGIWLAATAICVIGILIYANSFRGAFVLDDEFSIVRNGEIR